MLNWLLTNTHTNTASHTECPDAAFSFFYALQRESTEADGGKHGHANTHSVALTVEICWHVCVSQAALCLWCCWAVQLWHFSSNGDCRTELALKAVVHRHNKQRKVSLITGLSCQKMTLDIPINMYVSIVFFSILMASYRSLLKSRGSYHSAALWAWWHVLADTPLEFLDRKADMSWVVWVEEGKVGQSETPWGSRGCMKGVTDMCVYVSFSRWGKSVYSCKKTKLLNPAASLWTLHRCYFKPVFKHVF